MPIPTWTPGQVLTASDVNSWFVPLAAIKTSDQSVTSSTTMVNDTALVLTPAVSASYLFQCYIYFQAGTTGDFKWQFGVPAGAFMRYMALYQGTGGGFGNQNTNGAADVVAAQGNGAGVDNAVFMAGTLVMGSTAGNCQFKWAQNTSDGTASIVKAQSCLYLYRIA